MKNLIAIVLLLGAGSANAVPVLWTFQDVLFDDGGTLTGSFIFDVDSDTVVLDYYHPQEVWVQPFYFDIDIVATSPNGTNSPFDNWGYYSTDYVGEVLDYCGSYCIGSPPLPTADGADYQNGLAGRILQDCLVTTCDRTLTLNFGAPLTNAGGTVTLTGDEYLFVYCCPDTWTRNIVSGTIVGARVIPIPAAVWLFASGLGLLGWMRRKVS